MSWFGGGGDDFLDGSVEASGAGEGSLSGVIEENDDAGGRDPPPEGEIGGGFFVAIVEDEFRADGLLFGTLDFGDAFL